MSRVIPIDVIKSISGKYGSKSDTYFSTNTSSNKIRIAKMANPYKGPYTEKQLAQQASFAERQAAVTAWLNANKPSETNGEKGTELYQLGQQLKRKLGLSSVSQVLYKYMDEQNVITLPGAPTVPTTPTDPDEDNEGPDII